MDSAKKKKKSLQWRIQAKNADMQRARLAKVGPEILPLSSTISQKVKLKVLGAHLCPILCELIDCSLPGSSVHVILQARKLEWAAILISWPSEQPGKPWRLLQFMSFESVILSDYINLCDPLLLPSIFPNIRVFSSVLTFLTRWPKYWSFSFILSLPMNIQGWFPLGLIGLIFLLSK